MTILFQRSKIDIYRDGAWVPIAKSFNFTSAAVFFWGGRGGGGNFIFRPLTAFYSANGFHKFRCSVPMSYSRAHELVFSAYIRPLASQARLTSS